MRLRKKIFVTAICLLYFICVYSQEEIRFNSNNTSFPDSARTNGHTYDSVFYPASEHYNDNSVVLIVPKNLKTNRTIDLVFWFHGWHNNIDTAVQFYELKKQFLESKRNAVLVLAETAKNAPDSYGGKLEKQGVFKALVNDIMNKLKQEKIAAQKAAPGEIILAGHSGAYRVIAYILEDGNMPVAEVDLFDALYGQTDKFFSWIQQNSQHRFINWYTNHGGGTDEVSIGMMKQMDSLHVQYKLVEETSVTPELIKSNRILFVHSAREHNVIINRPDNWRVVLEGTTDQ
jgi:hypothetical protein